MIMDQQFCSVLFVSFWILSLVVMEQEKSRPVFKCGPQRSLSLNVNQVFGVARHLSDLSLHFIFTFL